MNKNTFKPEPINDKAPGDATHPGEILKDEIDYLNMNQKEFAQKMEMQPNVISEIINAKRSITPQIAIKIESVLGINAEFWLRLQAGYEVDKIRIRLKKQTQESKINS
jgi:HTH-type transcriptional regulator/antitoxin HigA